MSKNVFRTSMIMRNGIKYRDCKIMRKNEMIQNMRDHEGIFTELSFQRMDDHEAVCIEFRRYKLSTVMVERVSPHENPQ